MTPKTKETIPKRFISILSDYGFKVTFGNESDTRFLRKAIQLLIKSAVPVKSITFEKNDVAGLTKTSRSGIFDLTCTDEEGNVYIVEMQLNDFKHFIHRGKFYAFHRLNKMILKGRYRFNDLKPIYIISFLAGNTFKTQEFHQVGKLMNQHGEVIDDQITHIIVELDKWNKPLAALASDLDKLLYIMKFTETATINDAIPDSLSSAEWIEAMIKELDKRNMPIDQLIVIEMALAREGSMLAAEEEKIKKVQEESQKKMDFERKQAAQKIAKEKELAEEKIAKEKELAEEKIAKEKELAEEKIAKEKELAEEKIAKEKELTAKKLVEERKLAQQKLIKAKELSAKKLLLLKTMTIEQIALIISLPVEHIKKLVDEKGEN